MQGKDEERKIGKKKKKKRKKNKKKKRSEQTNKRKAKTPRTACRSGKQKKERQQQQKKKKQAIPHLYRLWLQNTGKTKVVLTGTHCRPSGQGSGRRDDDLAPPTLPAGQRCRPPQSHGTWPGTDEKKNRNRVGKGDGGRGGVIKGWAARQQPPVLGSVDQRDESEQMLRALSWCPTLRVFDSFVRCGR